MRRSYSLILALLLLLGQATLLAHEYDFTAHQDGFSCSICLHATPLTDAAVGTFSFELPLADSATEFHPVELQLSSITHSLYRARAPPVTPSL